MDSIKIIRDFMSKEKIEYLLVNSTNEFLVEYNDLEQNSRYKLTGFSGSTGEALVTPKTIYLFVDGRYHIQADSEVNHSIVTVVKLQTGEKYLEKLIEKIPEKAILGIFSKKVSQQKFEWLKSKRMVKLFDIDPLDNTYKSNNEENICIDKKFTGLTTQDKILKITADLKESEAIYLTDLDEVSYVYNLRNFSKNYTSKIVAKSLITKSGNKLFVSPDDLKNYSGKVFVDKSLINVYDYGLLKNPAQMHKNPVQYMKCHKTGAELEHLKEAFLKTDKAVRAIRDYINNNDNISEYDIDKKLEEYFKQFGAKSLSFKSIVAKDKNSALAHYSKSSKEEIIENGSLVLIDCGAYYEGGLATDITRVFVKGEPTELQKTVYTNVLRAFLLGYNTKIKSGITGFDIDNKVREFFAQNPIDGFVFNHGLGHGIGINVHEYPPKLSPDNIAKVQIEENMCFTIEPGLYNKEYFGVRLENSCYCKDGKIHSFTNMNYEDKLINYCLLSEQEKEWLSEFEVK